MKLTREQQHQRTKNFIKTGCVYHSSTKLISNSVKTKGSWEETNIYSDRETSHIIKYSNSVFQFQLVDHQIKIISRKAIIKELGIRCTHGCYLSFAADICSLVTQNSHRSWKLYINERKKRKDQENSQQCP